MRAPAGMARLGRALPALALVPAALAGCAPGPGGRPGWGWDGWWGGPFMGPLPLLVLLAVIIVIAVLALRGRGPSNRGGPRRSDKALDILNERFARGEIDRQEYEERKRALEE